MSSQGVHLQVDTFSTASYLLKHNKSKTGNILCQISDNTKTKSYYVDIATDDMGGWWW